MKISVDTKDLFNALKRITKIINKKSSQAILSYVHIETAGMKLQLTCTNLIQTIKTSCFATVHDGGAIAIPALILQKILSKVKTENIDIIVDDEKVQLLAGNATFNLIGVDAEEYPIITEGEIEIYANLEQLKLKTILKKVIPTMLKKDDNSCYTLNCAQLTIINGNELQVVTTDGYQLTKISRPANIQFINDFNENEILIPSKTIVELEKILSNTGDIEITISKRDISFRIDKTIIISKQLEGMFPKYNQVIPESVEANNFRLNRQELIDTIDTLSATANDFNQIDLKLSDRYLTLSTDNPLVGNSSAKLQVSTSQKCEICFNFQYLLTNLKSVKDNIVTLELHESMIIITDINDSSYLYLIMGIE